MGQSQSQNENIQQKPLQPVSLSSFMQLESSYSFTDRLAKVVFTKNSKIVIAFGEGDIKVLDPNANFNCVLSVNRESETTDCINSLIELSDGNLLTVLNSTNHIKIFSIKGNKYEEEKRITNRRGVDSIIELSKNRFASKRYDDITIWSGEAPYETIAVLNEACNKYRTNFIKMKNQSERLVYESDDVLHIWNLNTYQSESKIKNISYSCHIESDDKLIIGGGAMMWIINSNSWNVERTVNFGTNKGPSSMMILRDGNLLVGNSLKFFAIYDIKNNSITRDARDNSNYENLQKNVQNVCVDEVINGYTALYSINERTFLSLRGNEQKVFELWEY